MKMVQYTRDTGIKPCLLICERRKTMDILILESAGHLAVRKIPLTEQHAEHGLHRSEGAGPLSQNGKAHRSQKFVWAGSSSIINITGRTSMIRIDKIYNIFFILWLFGLFITPLTIIYSPMFEIGAFIFFVFLFLSIAVKIWQVGENHDKPCDY